MQKLCRVKMHQALQALRFYPQCDGIAEHLWHSRFSVIHCFESANVFSLLIQKEKQQSE